MNILEKICDERRGDVKLAAESVPVELLREQAGSRVHHSLKDALSDNSRTSIIAEMKKASPSAGLLREDYRPAEIAAVYRDAGAAGISVLTEPRHFLGAEEHLREVRAAVDLPILRKDFMCDPYQVYEAAAWGADVVLLIAAALDADMLRKLYDVAIDCGLDVLAEAHTAEEIEFFLGFDEVIIGVNSRNLKTLETDLATARDLAKVIPPDRLSVAESGIKTRSDISTLSGLSYNGFLIGESIIGQDDIKTALSELMR